MSIFKIAVLLISFLGCGNKSQSISIPSPIQNNDNINMVNKDLEGLSVAYFASGCFWCVEAVFESVIGVEEAVSGYSGGKAEDATYEKVSAGITEHAEAIAVYYNPVFVKYETLLTVFFDSHDPTTLNRQGPDAGYQYRSAIFYQNDNEKQIATQKIAQINDSKIYKNPVVTQVVPFDTFYPAEEYHQNYEKRNPNNGYVRNVSIPRLKRFQSKHPDLLKEKQ
jgi:peptide-methionine (S)-S-oxide reductase